MAMAAEQGNVATRPYLIAGTCALLFHGLLFALGPGLRSPRLPKERASHAVTVTLAKRAAPAPKTPVRPVVKKSTPLKRTERPVPTKEPAPVPEPIRSAPEPAVEKESRPVFQDEPATRMTETDNQETEPADETVSEPVAEPATTSETALRAGPAVTDAAGDREATPVYRLNRPPRYPRMARKRGWEGLVLLDVAVEKNGRVSEVNVAETSGFALLDGAAIDAVRDWQFEPGTRFGQPVAMQVKVPVRFRLKD